VTGKDFMNAVTNGQTDIVQLLLSLLGETGARYCVVGDLPSMPMQNRSSVLTWTLLLWPEALKLSAAQPDPEA